MRSRSCEGASSGPRAFFRSGFCVFYFAFIPRGEYRLDLYVSVPPSRDWTASSPFNRRRGRWGALVVRHRAQGLRSSLPCSPVTACADTWLQIHGFLLPPSQIVPSSEELGAALFSMADFVLRVRALRMALFRRLTSFFEQKESGKRVVL